MGNRNALKSGRWTAEARAMRAMIADLVREGREIARMVVA